MSEHDHTHHHDQDVVQGLFRSVAFWQAATFFLLICFVWANEVMDLPHLLYAQPPSHIDWFGASIITTAIILVAFITVAHTYVQQKRVLKGFIIVCSYCKKVHLEETNWEQMEHFVSERTLAEFSHGVCPDCHAKVMKELEESRSGTG